MNTIKKSLTFAGIAGAITITAIATMTSGIPSADAGPAGASGRTAIWVYVRALRGEGIWQTCRRIYRREVYRARAGGGPGEARCYIDAAYASDPRGYSRSRYR